MVVQQSLKTVSKSGDILLFKLVGFVA